jgi:hypothetical protein
MMRVRAALLFALCSCQHGIVTNCDHDTNEVRKCLVSCEQAADELQLGQLRPGHSIEVQCIRFDGGAR